MGQTRRSRVERDTTGPIDGTDRVEAPLPAAATPDRGERVESINRVSVPLAEDGSIAWDRMRQGTQEALRKALAASPGAPAAAGGDTIDPLLADYLWHSIGMIAANVAYATGHTEESSRVMLFSDEEKASFRALTAKVLNKHAGLFGKWADEMTLGFMVITAVQGKVGKLQKRPAEVRQFPRGATQETEVKREND